MSVTSRLPRSTARATAIAVVCAATAATVLSAAPALAASKVELKGATLDWGFKDSFRRYVGAGGITVADGAKQAPGNGVFTFVDGTGAYDTSTHASATAFKGSVRFSAHGGVLDIKLSDLKVTTTTTTGVITADVTTKDGGKDKTADDVPLADLDLSQVKPSQGAAMTFKDIPATLTEQGAAAFNGNYKKGEKLDPATLTFPMGGDPTKPDPTKPDPTKPSPTPTKPTPTKPTPTKPAPTTPAPTSDKVVKAKLSWGLKQSWRAYIASGGKTTVSEGATASKDSFGFPLDKGELKADARKVNTSFRGNVRFTYAAHGNLDIAFGAVRIEASGAKGALYVDVTTPQGVKRNVEFASLDLSRADFTARKDVVRLTAVPAAFTADGAAVFARPGEQSQYKAGEAIDPVTVALGLSEGADLDTAADTATTGGGGTAGGTGTSGTAATAGGNVGGSTTGGSLAATGSSAPTGPLLGAAGAIAVTGAAAVYAARRRTTLGRA
ncbi:HtaA domain-containing protein [Streptomyces sp. BPTC-684]|uniref:HtaA domain-containing protein n=1 Tax=Streptomyces sp. BPTC-684 TaxID=3043734 RepID=UPI0024B1A424|nr:HtaA domain-containing protein [Streptomyces sp. BPTC-684]WHM38956.1 HtaA domain-containing protein [Streptomyces sp. BPTC-684]